jgi:penicillin-binding protein activator
MKRLISLIILFSIVGCSTRTVSRISPDESIDLSGRWNDTDSRLVAEKMIGDILENERYKEYAKAKGKRPAIIVGDIQNRTSEHIDAANYIKRFEIAIFNSGLADLVESDDFRDKLRQERAMQQEFASPETAAQWGKEIGANLMLFGEMTSETDVLDRRRVVNYITTLYLTDVETNRRVWYGQHEIKKFIRN